MTRIPPTTTYQIEQPDRSPCCETDLVLVSPPIGYECRECGETYTLATGAADDDGTCTVELTSGQRAGEPCGRDLPCRFHS